MTDITTLVFDTETNGKRPKGRNVPLADEPALVQIAAILYWGRRPVAHLSCFMQPLDGQCNPAQIPTEEFFIKSGITQETVDRVGTVYKVGLGMFNNLVKRADRIVAHNIEFDDPIIRAAYNRVAASQQDFWDKPKFCTMRTLEPVLKLPGKFGFKYPSLDESYRALVDPMGFSGAHDAMVDVEACAKVLWAIEDKGIDLYRYPESWPK
ncbi:DNA polymerase III subunit epsilon [Pseudanabaena phage Pan1]|nr:DNA polymerase III subunit epsilon [Pseudanabaena phage Pan1]